MTSSAETLDTILLVLIWGFGEHSAMLLIALYSGGARWAIWDQTQSSACRTSSLPAVLSLQPL